MLLPWAEFWYNTLYHSSIGMTPFKVVYGKDPPSLVKYVSDVAYPPALQNMLLKHDLILQQLKTNLYKAQQFMKKYADKGRRPLEAI